MEFLYVFVSPTTLRAPLRTVATIRSHEKQTGNTLEIAKQSGKSYDKSIGFIVHPEKRGESLSKAQDAYS